MWRLRPMAALPRLVQRASGLFAAGFVALVSAAAHAQATPPQQPNLTRAPPVWLGLLVMFLLLAVVVTVSLMPSKRGHQD